MKKKFDAVIFDLDGVITKTALTHSAAWKKMFDDFLKIHAEKNNLKYKEFTHKEDYLPFVDGKPRYKGVADFLESRGIFLPFGDPSDVPSMDTVCGLGNMKNDAFNEVLRRDGVEIYPSTVALMKELREKGYRVGVASSSKNCEAVLEAAGLLYLVETRVDGVVSAEMGLKGKPEADIFTTAAKNLGCDYERSVVVEDAVSGVQAGRNGNFGLVIGIAREENKEELYINGADIVVEDLDEISIESINSWYDTGIEEDSWSVTYHDYDPKKERSREALLTVGNGYYGTRGAMEETQANPVNYPGTYMAGLYNRLVTKVADRDVENEDFVNIPNWLPVTFRIDDEDWFDVNNTNLLSIRRKMNFRDGVLSREMILEDKQGRRTEIVSERFSSMDNIMLAALRYNIRPLNYSGQIEVKSGINGKLINEGVERYKSLNSLHLNIIKVGFDEEKLFVLAETNQSKHLISEAAMHRLLLDGEIQKPSFEKEESEGCVSAVYSFKVEKGQQLSIEKLVSVCSDKEDFIEDALSSSLKTLLPSMRFEQQKKASAEKWAQLWNEMDIKISGDRMSQKLIRMHLFHLLVSVSHFNEKLDASITARGLHGEAYRGHIFWDELFILPLYDLHLPDVAKSMLMYRYRRLNKARDYAAQFGYKGAMFPWQSGSDGREETQVLHLNPLTGKWGDDHSSLQRHVSLAIAYNIWDYYWINDDIDFLKNSAWKCFLKYVVSGLVNPFIMNQQVVMKLKV
jgi:HAD superfamily hydrolase (TIGR01509 family)